MVDAEPLMDPSRETMIRIAGAPPGLVILRDSLGLLDSVRNAGPGTTLRIPVVGGMIGVASGSTRATAGADRSQVTRSVVVLGLAGWEAKFVIRALEERGWTVDARLAIAPRLGTVQGRPFPLDTARHAAVIALDSTAASYARELLGYVRSGGGVILGEGASSRVPALALAGYGGNTRASRTRGFNSEGKELLGFRHLSNLREGAATLESRNGNVVLAALRLGAGRVVQSGYRDTWRWRMEGGEKGVESHRAWWASLVATVAHRSQGAAPLGDPAPLTSLILSSGPATTLPERHATPVVWPFLLGLTVLALYAEWFLRRMRGAG
jgi:hypothetical protein